MEYKWNKYLYLIIGILIGSLLLYFSKGYETHTPLNDKAQQPVSFLGVSEVQENKALTTLSEKESKEEDNQSKNTEKEFKGNQKKKIFFPKYTPQ